MKTGSAQDPIVGSVADVPIHLSIVIPAYNEARRLGASLGAIRRFLDLQTYTAEVVIIENASTDRTFEVASEIAAADPRIRVLREPRRGKGAALRRGMLAAQGEYRFLCDADLSMPIEEVENFLPPILENVDVAIGSREAAGAVRYEEPGRRHLMGRVFNTLVRGLLVPEIQDTQCGFKCFTAAAAEAVFAQVSRPGFGFDVEALVIARCFGYRIEEIPVHWYFDGDSRVRIVRDSLGTIVDVFVIGMKRLRGAYGP